MYYTYVLKGASKPKYYIGYSANLKQRITSHNNGSVIATKYLRPLQLIYYEAYREESMARDRELKLKQRGKAWKALKQRIDYSA
jgi:putative endonuclease